MAEKTTPRLKTKYTEEVRPALLKEFQHSNVMEVGRVVKVVVNMGVGEAAHDSKMIEGAVRDLAAITGGGSFQGQSERVPCAGVSNSWRAGLWPAGCRAKPPAVRKLQGNLRHKSLRLHV